MQETIVQFIEREEVQLLLIRTGTFLGLVLLAIVVGQYFPNILRSIIQRFLPSRAKTIYDNLIAPIQNPLQVAATLVFIALALNSLQAYPGVYSLLRFFVDLAVTISVAWFLSRLFRQFVRIYGIEMIRKLGQEVDEMLLVAETVANVLIGFFAILAFARNRFDLLGLMAGLGLGGLAIAFAAQKTLEQLIGTMVIYLDRPFIPGEYIRIDSSLLPNGLYGRVESIGLRSTKIRTAAKGTLVIIPNSTLASLEIENITRGKKVMVLLYLEFPKFLSDAEQALVQQVVVNGTNSLFGIDPGSTNVTILDDAEKQASRARITFFILGSTESSVQLRKRLLELANETIYNKLVAQGIEFKVQEPAVYVESPVPI